MQGEMLYKNEKPPVICADVDGTIILTDLLYESLLLVLKREPLTFLLLPFWLLQGRAHLKKMLAKRAATIAAKSAAPAVVVEAPAMPSEAEVEEALRQAEEARAGLALVARCRAGVETCQVRGWPWAARCNG